LDDLFLVGRFQGPVDDTDRIDRRHRPKRFSQWAKRQNFSIAQALAGIQRNNMKISDEPVMRQTIVEHQNLGAPCRNRPKPRKTSIPGDPDGHIGGVTRQNEGLVTDFISARYPSSLPINQLNAATPPAAIPARRQRDPVTAVL